VSFSLYHISNILLHITSNNIISHVALILAMCLLAYLIYVFQIINILLVRRF